MTEEQARAKCQAFANEHKVVFEDDGSCGFGRPCVGFTYGGSYVDYNPVKAPDYLPIPELECDACYPPRGVKAYHKHECFAVLYDDGEEGARAEAVKQLAQWVASLEAQGRVERVEYLTGATGIQALVSGARGQCFMVRPQ